MRSPIRPRLAGLATVLLFATLPPGVASADQLVTVESSLTNTSNQFETTPTVGSVVEPDGSVTSYVVYTSRAVLVNGLGPGDIYL